MFLATPFRILIVCFASFVACHALFDKLFDRFGQCKADAKEPWSYRGNNGPQYWGDTYPDCNKNEQSPIAISRYSTIRDSGLPKLSMINYNIPITESTIENNGHTVQITPMDSVERTIFVNNSTYRLLQMHFHWGDKFHPGSEHTLNRRQYSMELHLVHQNADDALAVVGVFFQESLRRNSEIETMIKFFPEVLYKGNQTQLTSSLNLNKLVPANPSSYYRYAGSLTTPGCTEGVTWSVLTNSLPVGNKQIREFQNLFSATEEDVKQEDSKRNCKLVNNFRPVQPLNDRQVLRSE